MRVQTCYLTQRALEQRTKGCGLHRVAKAIQSFLKRFDFLCCSQIIGRKKSFSSFFLIFLFFFSTNLSLADKNLLKIELLVMEELRIKEILQKKMKFQFLLWPWQQDHDWSALWLVQMIHPNIFSEYPPAASKNILHYHVSPETNAQTNGILTFGHTSN